MRPCSSEACSVVSTSKPLSPLPWLATVAFAFPEALVPKAIAWSGLGSLHSTFSEVPSSFRRGLSMTRRKFPVVASALASPRLTSDTRSLGAEQAQGDAGRASTAIGAMGARMRPSNGLKYRGWQPLGRVYLRQYCVRIGLSSLGSKRHRRCRYGWLRTCACLREWPARSGGVRREYRMRRGGNRTALGSIGGSADSAILRLSGIHLLRIRVLRAGRDEVLPSIIAISSLGITLRLEKARVKSYRSLLGALMIIAIDDMGSFLGERGPGAGPSTRRRSATGPMPSSGMRMRWPTCTDDRRLRRIEDLHRIVVPSFSRRH